MIKFVDAMTAISFRYTSFVAYYLFQMRLRVGSHVVLTKEQLHPERGPPTHQTIPQKGQRRRR